MIDTARRPSSPARRPGSLIGSGPYGQNTALGFSFRLVPDFVAMDVERILNVGTRSLVPSFRLARQTLQASQEVEILRFCNLRGTIVVRFEFGH